MNPTKPIRRNKAQWQALVDQQQQSQLSATAFCKTQHIGYASFCQWRKRLSQAEGRITPSERARLHRCLSPSVQRCPVQHQSYRLAHCSQSG